MEIQSIERIDTGCIFGHCYVFQCLSATKLIIGLVLTIQFMETLQSATEHCSRNERTLRRFVYKLQTVQLWWVYLSHDEQTTTLHLNVFI